MPLPDVPPLAGGSEPEAAAVSRRDEPASLFEPAMRAHAPRVAGALSTATLRERIRAAMPVVRGCYERALTERPSLAGPVSVRFVVTPSGAVQDAEVRFESSDEPELERCIEAALDVITFPPVPGGGVVIVSYPFMLQPEST